MDIEKIIQLRINTIQKKYNFNPSLGVEQIQPNMAIDYGAFKELLSLIKKAKLDVEVPYDSAGLNSQQLDNKNQERKRYIYFQRQEQDNIWKIGRSLSPLKRKTELQVGNSKNLFLFDKVDIGNLDDAKLIEKRLKRHLRKYNIKGEWFDLTSQQIKNIIISLNNKNYSFLDHMLPKKKEQ